MKQFLFFNGSPGWLMRGFERAAGWLGGASFENPARLAPCFCPIKNMSMAVK